jgi:hypothetical protein
MSLFSKGVYIVVEHHLWYWAWPDGPACGQSDYRRRRSAIGLDQMIKLLSSRVFITLILRERLEDV